MHTEQTEILQMEYNKRLTSTIDCTRLGTEIIISNYESRSPTSTINQPSAIVDLITASVFR